MSDATDIQRQWVTAILEGRMATADYLTPGLPRITLEGMIRPPKGARNRWETAGEIGPRRLG